MFIYAFIIAKHKVAQMHLVNLTFIKKKAVSYAFI